MDRDVLDPHEFFTERMPAQWNRVLAEQERAVSEARRTLEDMRAVRATLAVEVDGEPFFLNVNDGLMQAGPEPEQPPAIRVVQDRVAFERLAAEAGDSALALLGGLSGLAGSIKLTRSKLEMLVQVEGALRFAVTGPDGFSLGVGFGGAPPDTPACVLEVDEATYAELRGGRLDPQQAFMAGRIQVSGDLQLAMQLALAVLSPD